MKVLVVENDPLVAFDINDMLIELEYGQSPVADNVADALVLVEKEKPDVVLVDIELNGEKNGIDLGAELHQRNIPFIYLTGLRARPVLDQALQTFPYANLAKPVNKWQLRNSLVEIQQNAKKIDPPHFITVMANSKRVKIDVADILYLIAARNNCEIHTKDKRYVASTPMKNVWNKINQTDFIKVHRSYVVNLAKVKAYMGNIIYFEESEKEVTMSQSFRADFVERMNIV